MRTATLSRARQPTSPSSTGLRYQPIKHRPPLPSKARHRRGPAEHCARGRRTPGSTSAGGPHAAAANGLAVAEVPTWTQTSAPHAPQSHAATSVLQSLVPAAGTGSPPHGRGAPRAARRPPAGAMPADGPGPTAWGLCHTLHTLSCRPRGLRARPATGGRAHRWRLAAPASRRPPPKPQGRPRRAARAASVSSCQVPPPASTPLESQGDFDQLTLPHTSCILFSPKTCVHQMAEKCTHSHAHAHAYVNVAHMRAGQCAVGAGSAGARDLGPTLDVNGVRHQRHAANQARRAARRQAAAAARAFLRQLRLPNNIP